MWVMEQRGHLIHLQVKSDGQGCSMLESGIRICHVLDYMETLTKNELFSVSCRKTPGASELA